ncbi:MAG: amino acid ABC transporter substrate-binding protein [Desulfobacterales bacterium]|nr:amino acid ABC transporter substrate-binding protein [Desulfobacterales bacterium]
MRENGKLVGLSIELFHTIQKELKIKNRIHVYPWARAYKLATVEKNVLIFSIARVPSREKLFKWAGKIVRIKQDFYKLKSNKDININSIEDIKPFRVGVPRNDSRHQFLIKNNFRKIHTVIRQQQAVKMLFKNRVNLIIEDPATLFYLTKKSNLDPLKLENVYSIKEMEVDLYFAFSKKTSDHIVNQFKFAFEKIRQTSAYNKIMKKYGLIKGTSNN